MSGQGMVGRGWVCNAILSVGKNALCLLCLGKGVMVKCELKGEMRVEGTGRCREEQCVGGGRENEGKGQ